ncbi:MAG TPA: alpha/beta hydrolase family protein [Steroidobacter sp.]|uniref:alpha/beta hydrolase n=1 Tax=Steroidobacter sp. TaxID=1978227 RepID=UPI002EDBB496
MFLLRTRSHAFFASVCLVLLAVPALASEMVSRELESPTLQRSWAYEVYLPSGYDRSRSSYPVFYLFHGNGGSRHDWLQKGRIQRTADSLIARREIPATIIVMPDAGTSWFVDGREKMETAVIRDLIPDVEKNLRVLKSRDGRLIGGLSMGGYGALRFALKYPEMFAAAALLSPAIYDPLPPPKSSARTVGTFGRGEKEFDDQVWQRLNYPTLWQGYLAKRTPVPMYINSGDDDEFMIEAEATRLYSLLRANEQPAELRIVNGTHSWEVWEDTIDDAMRYIFRFAAKPTAAE